VNRYHARKRDVWRERLVVVGEALALIVIIACTILILSLGDPQP
jgi:hypothetical protein